jgi:hypothetical protein
MTQESVLCRASGVVARTIAGETILVPVRRRAQEMGLFTLNGVGTFVWKALDGTRSLREIAGAVASAFEVDPARALADVSAFGADLERTGCATARAEAAR